LTRRLGAHKPNHYHEYRCIHDVSYYGKPTFKDPMLSVPQATKGESFLPQKVEKHDDVEWLEIVDDHWLPSRSAAIPGRDKDDRVVYFEKVVKRPASSLRSSPRKNQIMPIHVDDENEEVEDTLQPLPLLPNKKRLTVSPSMASITAEVAVSKALNDPTLMALYEADASRTTLDVEANSKENGTGKSKSVKRSKRDRKSSKRSKRRDRRKVAAVTTTQPETDDAATEKGNDAASPVSLSDPKKLDDAALASASKEPPAATPAKEGKTGEGRRRKPKAKASKPVTTGVDIDVGAAPVAKVTKVGRRRRGGNKDAKKGDAGDNGVAKLEAKSATGRRRGRRRRIKPEQKVATAKEAAAAPDINETDTPQTLKPRKRTAKKTVTKVKREDPVDIAKPSKGALSMTKLQSMMMFKKYEKVEYGKEDVMDL